jgi:uncharacterized protein (DUF1697 family)
VEGVERYVAFLRGMNLGGRRIKNEQLRKEFEALGLAEVACFRASGNVVFAAEEDDEATLAERIEVALEEALGYEVPVYLRGEDELRAVAGRQPFAPAAQRASRGKLQVAFMPAVPEAAGRKRALALATAEERLAIDGRQLYWLPRGGLSESDLDLDAIAAALGPITIRTMGTVEQIVAKYLA